MIAVGSSINRFLSLLVVGHSVFVAASGNINEQDSTASGSSLRGNTRGDGSTLDEYHRKLQLDMPGDISCTPHESKDGSAVCSYRTMIPGGAGMSSVGTDADVTYDTSTHLACINQPADGYQYCVNLVADVIPNAAGLSGPVPGGGMMPDELPSSQVVEPEPVMPEPAKPVPMPTMPRPTLPVPEYDLSQTFPEYGGRCPSVKPERGSWCDSAIPSGLEMIQCTYPGPETCTCSFMPGTKVAVGWVCASGQPVEQLPPVTLPANPVPQPIETVPAQIQEAVIAPTMVPTKSPRVGSTGIAVPPVSGCPATRIADSTPCDYNTKGFSSTPQRCPYPDPDSPTGYVSCDCTKEFGYQCRNFQG